MKVETRIPSEYGISKKKNCKTFNDIAKKKGNSNEYSGQTLFTHNSLRFQNI